MDGGDEILLACFHAIVIEEVRFPFRTRWDTGFFHAPDDMFVQFKGEGVCFEIDASAGAEEIRGDRPGVGVAGAIPVGVTGVGFLGVGGGEEGVVENYFAEFGGDEGEEGGGGLGVYGVGGGA